MKKFMISLLMIAATLNAMAITYTGKVQVVLRATSNNAACGAVVATSDALNDGLNPMYYAELNDEGKQVLVYVEYNSVRYEHFGSSATTMRNMPLIIKANASSEYKMEFYEMEGAIEIYDKVAGANIDKSQDYIFTIEDEQKNTIIADRFVINFTFVNMKGNFENPSGEWNWVGDFSYNGGLFTKELTLAADTWYNFFMNINGTEMHNNSEFSRGDGPKGGFPAAEGSNSWMYADIAGTYTFTWNYAAQTLTVTFPAAPAPTCTTVRTGLNVDQYYTICLPKAVTAANGASFWNMTNRGEGVAYLVEAELPLVAGRPYIFQATAEELCVELSGDDAAVGAAGALVGTFAAMDQAALNAAVAANDGSDIYLLKGNELWLVSGQTGNSLPAYRAYIVYNQLIPGNPQPAPGRRVRAIPMQGQTATGVENLNAAEAPVKKIIDGKMYILRGENMYDATGRMVK